MTTPVRALAQWLMRQAADHAPPASRDWANAMLHELEFVEGDWAALFWALGGVAAIMHHAGRRWISERTTKAQQWKEQAMEQMGKKAGLLIAGAVAAIALSATGFGLLFWTAVTFPQLGLDHAEWTHILTIIVIPGILCIAGAIWLWRRKKPMALGILLSTVVMVTHVAVHFAHRWHAH